MAEHIAEDLFVTENGAEFLGCEMDFEEREDGEIYFPVRNKDGRVLEIVDSDGLEVYSLYGFAVESSLGKRYLVDSTSMDSLHETIDHLAQVDGWLTVYEPDDEAMRLTRIKATTIVVIADVTKTEAEKYLPSFKSLYFKNHSN